MILNQATIQSVANQRVVEGWWRKGKNNKEKAQFTGGTEYRNTVLLIVPLSMDNHVQ